MSRRPSSVVYLTVLLSVAPSPAVAQQAPGTSSVQHFGSLTWTLKAEDFVEVSLLGGDKLKGRFYAADSQGLTLRFGTGTTTIREADITSVAVRRGTRAKVGALVGFIVGAGVGAAIGARDNEVHYQSCTYVGRNPGCIGPYTNQTESMLLYGILGGSGGLLIGTIIGRSKKNVVTVYSR